ncbi:unnamed protein product [Nesidiocoris tenuis]|uniref:Uncharacterized protein n=1 Tax=Nesidiocoris tenuis TaxID=355587 RepID=A0A6H5H1E9_9HEMI|nr:unnamed protein product [Nesidiocoris tenuis]
MRSSGAPVNETLTPRLYDRYRWPSLDAELEGVFPVQQTHQSEELSRARGSYFGRRHLQPLWALSSSLCNEWAGKSTL